MAHFGPKKGPQKEHIFALLAPRGAPGPPKGPFWRLRVPARPLLSPPSATLDPRDRFVVTFSVLFARFVSKTTPFRQINRLRSKFCPLSCQFLPVPASSSPVPCQFLASSETHPCTLLCQINGAGGLAQRLQSASTARCQAFLEYIGSYPVPGRFTSPPPPPGPA